jgi:hypothetical protein
VRPWYRNKTIMILCKRFGLTRQGEQGGLIVLWNIVILYKGNSNNPLKWILRPKKPLENKWSLKWIIMVLFFQRFEPNL